jgi:hypothetical protein
MNNQNCDLTELQLTVLIKSVPVNFSPLKVSPVRVAEISPQEMPVERILNLSILSGTPSLLMSLDQ